MHDHSITRESLGAEGDSVNQPEFRSNTKQHNCQVALYLSRGTPQKALLRKWHSGHTRADRVLDSLRVPQRTQTPPPSPHSHYACPVLALAGIPIILFCVSVYEKLVVSLSSWPR